MNESTFTETANRHLEDLDLLFAGKSNIAWRAEKEFELAKGTPNNGAQAEESAHSKAVDIV